MWQVHKRADVRPSRSLPRGTSHFQATCVFYPLPGGPLQLKKASPLVSSRYPSRNNSRGFQRPEEEPGGSRSGRTSRLTQSCVCFTAFPARLQCPHSTWVLAPELLYSPQKQGREVAPKLPFWSGNCRAVVETTSPSFSPLHFNT